MKTRTIILSFSLAVIAQMTIAQTFEWAKQIGGTGWDTGYSIAIDGSGNVYTTGRFQGTVDFDPGPGTFNLTGASSADIFISKLDALGNFLWAKQMGGSSFGDNEGFSIKVDPSGNVYTTGYFQGTVDFDPGPATFNLTSAGGHDIFISKLDASGNFLWAKQIGGNSSDQGLSLTVDDLGNVYTTGYFFGIVDFDPGAGTFNLTSAGGFDIFISKLDASGNFLWAKQMGGAEFDEGRSIAIDGSGNVYTTGYFQGTADFNPGSATNNLTSVGDRDIFISKLDASGNFVWAKSMGGTSSDVGKSLAVDTYGNVYTTGYFEGTVDFDPGTGTFDLSATGGYDIFISKLDASGNFDWAKQMGGTGYEIGRSIAIDGSGNVYTTGSFQGIVDFDPGPGTFTLISAGAADIFISKLDNSGNFLWAKQMGDYGTEEGHSITIDGSGNVYTTGYFEVTVDFDPGPGTFNLTSAGGTDIFVHKMQCANTGTDVQTACDSYTWIDGNTYTTSNNAATFTLTNAAGCDSIVTLNLTINSVSDISTTVVGTTITANNSSATYQWLDCNNNYAEIPGETNQSYTPIANGSYAVELTENGCVDTSACVAIATVGVIENLFKGQITVYPNPTNDQLTIVFDQELYNVQMTVINAIGQVVYHKDFSSVSNIELNLDGPAGIYFIDIVDGDKRALFKVIKE